MIINSEEGGRLSFPMEIPMDTFRHLADEIEYQIRDFQIGLEILKGQYLLGVYEDSSIHAAKIRLFLVCHSERSEESRVQPLYALRSFALLRMTLRCIINQLLVIFKRSSSLSEARCSTHTISKFIASASRVPYSLSAR